MKKQLTLKKLSLFVLTALLFVLLSLAFAFTGTARAYADGDGQPCPDGQHTLGDIFVIEKQTCVSHGVGVRYCQECGLSFNVVIPADGISHKVNSEGKCSECGATGVNYVITENLPDKDYVEVGQVQESELQSITIPATVKTKGQEKEVHVADKAFEGNETIESVTILGTPEIGAEAFKDCKNLKRVRMAEGTQNIAADAFVGTKFYEDKLAAAKGTTEKDELQSISIPISKKVGDTYQETESYYLLKVVDPTAETEPESKGRRNAANETAESPKTFTYKVASGTKVIAEKAFADLANLVEVTLNPDLLTVGANAFDGCSALKTIYIAKAEGEEQPVSDKSFANVAGLAPYNTIYYWGEPRVDENKKDTIFKALANVIRYYSLTEPTDNTHTYWHMVEVDGVELPTIWDKVDHIALDTSECITRFRKGEEFSSKGLVVTAHYESGATKVLQPDTGDAQNPGYILNSSEYQKDVVTEADKPYTIKISFLEYAKATYTVTVADAYTITINYGYEGQATKTELIFVQDGFTLPKAPTREGYKFLGWKVGDAQELMQAGEKFTPTADTTVTAQWEKLYKVTATASNASTTLPTNTYYASGETVTFSVTPANGYKLVSVKNGNATLTAQDGKYSVTVGKEDIVITVETAAVTVTATATATDSVTPQVSYNDAHDTATITLTTPTKEGYRFDGWTVKVGSADPADLEGNTYSLKLQHSDVTVIFTAKWTEMLITSASVALQLNENTLTLVATVTANGFTLENIAGVKLQLGDENPITGSEAEATDGFTLTYTLTALTAKADGYAIKFVLELTKETKDVYQNGTITCGEGHHDFSGNRYALADGKLTVTAPLKVTFVSDHGTAPAPQSVFAGETLNLDDITEPTATGYVFLYWYTTATDGTETKQSGTITVTKSMTLHAKWAEIHTTSTTISNYALLHLWDNNAQYDTVKIDNNISVTFTSPEGVNVNNSGKYDAATGQWRAYESDQTSVNVIASNDATIISVKITFTPYNNGRLTYGEQTLEWVEATKVSEATINDQNATFGVTHVSGTNAGQVRITAIEVVYYGGKVLSDQEKADEAINDLKLNMTKVISKVGTTIYEGFTLPLSTIDGVTLEWAVSDNSVARIEDNTVIVTRAEGSDKPFTLSVQAKINGATASVTVDEGWQFTVKGMPQQGTEFDATFTPSEDYEENTPLKGQTVIKKEVSFEFGGSGTQIQYYKTGTAIRAYKGNTIKISVLEGYNITKITLTFGDDDGSNEITADVGVFSTDTWSGLNNSVMLTVGGANGNRRISSIRVDYVYGMPAGVPAESITAAAKTAAEAEDFIAKSYDKAENVQLPTAYSNGASYSWVIKGEADSEIVSVTNNVLEIKQLPDEATQITLAVTVSYGNYTLDDAVEIIITIEAKSAEPEEKFIQLTEPKTGDYLYSAMHKGTRLYASSLELSNHYIETTDDVTQAVKFTLETKDNHWYIKMGEKYLEVDPYNNSSNKVSYSLRLVASPTSGAYWEWDSDIKIFKQKPVADETGVNPADTYFYIGMRDNADYTTMSPSDIMYITGNNKENLDVSQHPARFGTYGVETTEPEDEKSVESFGVSNLLAMGGDKIPAIGIQVTTKGYDEATLKAATLVINDKSYTAGEGSRYNTNDMSEYKFYIGDAYQLEAGTYDVKFVLDGQEYTKPMREISAENTVTYNNVKGVLAADGQKLTLTLSAEGTVEPEEKSITSVYNLTVNDQNKTLDFYANVKGLSASTMTSQNTYLVVNGTVLISLKEATDSVGTAIHFVFDLSTITGAGNGLLTIKIGEDSYPVVLDGEAGDPWSSQYSDDSYEVSITGTKGAQASMTITAKSAPEVTRYSIQSVSIGQNEGKDKLQITFIINENLEGKQATLKIGEQQSIPANGDTDGTEFVFELTPSDSLNGATLTFSIEGAEMTGTLPSNVDGDTEISGKSYKLTKSAEDTLQITVTTKEEPVESGSFTITISNVKNYQTSYSKYEWEILDQDKKTVLFEGSLYGAASNPVDGVTSFIQFSRETKSGKKKWAYFVNSKETPAPITGISITYQIAGTSESKIPAWSLMTSNTAYTVNDKSNPAVSGNSTYDKKAITGYNNTVGTIKWENITGSDKFFALYLDDSMITGKSAALVTSITIEYGGKSTGGGETTDSDLQKAQAALDSLTIESNVTQNKSITLPADNGAGVTYNWTLTDGAGVAQLDGNTLAITQIESEATVKLSATATYNGKTTPAKEFAIQVSAKSSGGDSQVALMYTLDTTGTLKGKNNSYASNCDITSGAMTWNLEGNSQQNPWRMGGKNIDNTPRRLTSTTALQGKVTKVVITFGEKESTLTVKSAKLNVFTSKPTSEEDPTGAKATPTYSRDFSTNGSESITIENTTDEEWENCYYQIVLNVTVTAGSNKFVELSKLEFYGYPASSDQGMEGPTTLSYTANMNNGNVESDGLWLALAVGGSALLLVSSLAVVLLLRKHN